VVGRTDYGNYAVYWRGNGQANGGIVRYYQIILTGDLVSEMFTSGERTYNVIGGLPESATFHKCEMTGKNLRLTFETDETNNGELGTEDDPILLSPIMGKEYHQ